MKKETVLSTNDDFEMFSRFPGNVLFLVSFFGKSIGFLAPGMVPWLSKKSEDQSGGPKTNLEVFGEEGRFQFFKKTCKSISPMPCKTKPCQSSRESPRMVHATPRTPPDLPHFLSASGLHGKSLKQTCAPHPQNIVCATPNKYRVRHTQKISCAPLTKKSEDQSGGPRTNLEVFGDEVSFQYFPKT